MDNTSFLDNVSQTDPLLMQQIKADCDKLLFLRAQMMIAEERLKQAQKAYSDFATKQLPQKFADCGLDMLSTSSGNKIRIVTKTRASIKKGEDNGKAAKASIAEWLRAHNGAELIKEQLIVPQSQLEALRSAGITYQEDMDINTNSLKALIIDMLGQKGSPALINTSDLPSGLSFYQWEEAEVD